MCVDMPLQRAPDGTPAVTTATTEITGPPGTADPFDDTLLQMQSVGGFTIVRRRPRWAHVYRDAVGAARPDPYDAVVGHIRVQQRADGRLQFEDLAIEHVLLRTCNAAPTGQPTLDAVIRTLQDANFELLARGSDWIDVRRDTPGSIARFTHMHVYRWHRVTRGHAGQMHLGYIPPEGWLAIEVQRMISAGWRLEHTDGSSAVLRRTRQCPGQTTSGPRILQRLRVLSARLRRTEPQWLHLQVDPEGHVERELRTTP